MVMRLYLIIYLFTGKDNLAYVKKLLKLCNKLHILRNLLHNYIIANIPSNNIFLA